MMYLANLDVKAAIISISKELKKKTMFKESKKKMYDNDSTNREPQ